MDACNASGQAIQKTKVVQLATLGHTFAKKTDSAKAKLTNKGIMSAFKYCQIVTLSDFTVKYCLICFYYEICSSAFTGIEIVECQLLSDSRLVAWFSGCSQA